MLSTENKIARQQTVVNGELSTDHGELPCGVHWLSMAPRTPKPKKMPDDFWVWFDQALIDQKLNDIKAAEISGISKSVISNARNQKKVMSAESVGKLAKALGYPKAMVFKLAGIDDDEDAAAAIDVELAHYWSKLGDNDREDILALIKVKVKRAKQGESERAGR